MKPENDNIGEDIYEIDEEEKKRPKTERATANLKQYLHLVISNNRIKLDEVPKHVYEQNFLQFVRPYMSYEVLKVVNMSKTKPKVIITPQCSTTAIEFEDNRVYPMNIGYFDLNWIEDESGKIDYPLPSCECGASINKYSKVENKIWTCEFCKRQIVNVKKVPDLPSTLNEVRNPRPVKAENALRYVLCIDTSGSMNKNPAGRAKTNPVIIWSILKKAAERTIERICEDSPEAIVGLVAFSEYIDVYGDCEQKPLRINKTAKDESNHILFAEADPLATYVEVKCGDFMTEPISKTKDKLLQELKKIEPNFETALGPGLVSAMGLLKEARPGSQIIVYTDGITNIGFGNLESGKKSDLEFYHFFGLDIKNSSFFISFFTLSENCAMKELYSLVDSTGGVFRQILDPDEEVDISLPRIHEKVTDLNIDVITDTRLKLIPMGDAETNEDKTSLTGSFPTVPENSIFFFEFDFSDSEKKRIELRVKDLNMGDIPIQIKCEWTSGKFIYTRVVTDLLHIVPTLPEVDFKDYRILRKYIGKQSGKAISSEVERGKLAEKMNVILSTILCKKETGRVTGFKEKSERKSQCRKEFNLFLKSLKDTVKDKTYAVVNSLVTIELHFKDAKKPK